MEALGNGVVFGKSPHTCDGLDPLDEGFGESSEIRESLFVEVVDMMIEFSGVYFAGFC